MASRQEGQLNAPGVEEAITSTSPAIRKRDLSMRAPH
jgi:hypothetical protein